MINLSQASDEKETHGNQLKSSITLFGVSYTKHITGLHIHTQHIFLQHSSSCDCNLHWSSRIIKLKEALFLFGCFRLLFGLFFAIMLNLCLDLAFVASVW